MTSHVELFGLTKLSSNTRKALTFKEEDAFLGTMLKVYLHPTMGEFYLLSHKKPNEPLYYLNSLPFVCASTPTELTKFFFDYQTRSSIKAQIALTNPKIGGIANREPAYPRGGFANAQEYEQYVMLYVNFRDDEIAAYLAGLAGAPAFNARDPFPHGHCYLNLLPRDKQRHHYKRGQDYLTKEKLEAMQSDIQENKILCYHLRAATADAHVDLQKDPPPNAILIKAGDLQSKLKSAFEDSIVDWDEYQEIFYNNPITFRN